MGGIWFCFAVCWICPLVSMCERISELGTHHAYTNIPTNEENTSLNPMDRNASMNQV